MKRKVQQLGSSTLAVTVPAEWARQHDIEKGDEVIVQRDENGGSLLLVPEEPSLEDTDAVVDADDLDADDLERAIVSQYVLGRQLVRVQASEPLTRAHTDAIARAERRLMGLGVVEQADSHATVRCSVAPSDFDLPTLLGRIGRTEATMRTDAVRAVVEADADRARAVASRYEQVEKLFYLFLRLVFATYRNPRLNQAVGLETGFPLIGFRSVAQDLVLMADVACEIAGLVTDGEPARPDEATAERLTTLAATLDDGVDTTIAAVAAPTHDATTSARDHLDRVTELAAELNDHLAAERPEPLLVCQRTVTLLERSARHARDSLSVATHLAFRADTELVDR